MLSASKLSLYAVNCWLCAVGTKLYTPTVKTEDSNLLTTWSDISVQLLSTCSDIYIAAVMNQQNSNDKLVILTLKFSFCFEQEAFVLKVFPGISITWHLLHIQPFDWEPHLWKVCYGLQYYYTRVHWMPPILYILQNKLYFRNGGTGDDAANINCYSTASKNLHWCQIHSYTIVCCSGFAFSSGM